MPQSKEVQREQARLRKRKQRDKGSVTSNSVTEQGVEMIPVSYVMGITGIFETLPERPRFLTLSDGQVLDRLYKPEGHTSGDQRMQACNESFYNFHPRKG